MSSSRSIAAARNRRSGDSTSSQAQISRPNRSIAAQASFSGIQQPQTQQQPRRPLQQPQLQQQQQYQQQQFQTPQLQQPQLQQPQLQQQQGLTSITKLSVSDAIGLVTLRLGRLETFMFDVQAGAMGGKSNDIPDNTQLVDKSVMTSIINRIETLEKKEPTNTNTNTVLNATVAKIEKEIKEIKELLNSHISTYSNFVNDTQTQILEINAELDEIDNKLTVSGNSLLDTSYSNILSHENEEVVIDDVEDNEVEENENVSTNLKEAIQKELENTSF